MSSHRQTPSARAARRWRSAPAGGERGGHCRTRPYPARWAVLTRRSPAAHSGITDDNYDLRQLALAAVDLAVASMGFGREATLDKVLDTLTGLAARMQPAEEHASEWRDVAQLVVKGLLNDAREPCRVLLHVRRPRCGACTGRMRLREA